MSSLRLCAVVLLSICVAVGADLRWGRATFYGNEPWLWSIHEGSCGFGYIWPDEPLGWDVAAMADVHYEYSGSCGTCYEVFCEPMTFSDGYGNSLDRTNVCYDPSASVVVRITDTCPCNYPNNFYSNKRWCCGDMDHLDLSVWAFEKLADTKWGVIGLKYRPVSCDYVPAKEAPAPENPFQGVPPPAGATKPNRPRFEQRSSSSSTPRERPDLNEVYDQAKQEAPPVIAFSGPSSKKSVGVFGGRMAQSWTDASWKVYSEKRTNGPSGGKALCRVIAPRGAISFKTDQKAFEGKVSMEFWVKTDSGIPDININVQGPEGFCRFVRLLDINSSGELDGFTRYDLFLGNFDRYEDEVIAFASSFIGCGGNGAGQINQIIFKNDLPAHAQEVCLDSLQILGD